MHDIMQSLAFAKKYNVLKLYFILNIFEVTIIMEF